MRPREVVVHEVEGHRKETLVQRLSSLELRFLPPASSLPLPRSRGGNPANADYVVVSWRVVPLRVTGFFPAFFRST